MKISPIKKMRIEISGYPGYNVAVTTVAEISKSPPEISEGGYRNAYNIFCRKKL